jgi:hypothetical protein
MAIALQIVRAAIVGPRKWAAIKAIATKCARFLRDPPRKRILQMNRTEALS